MILKFWYWLFGKGCEHKWKIHKQGGIDNREGIRIGTYYELQCEHCGNFKAKNLIV